MTGPLLVGHCYVPGPDPRQFAVVHRDVGGILLEGEHRADDHRCWCIPLIMTDEDARRGVFRALLANMGRTH